MLRCSTLSNAITAAHDSILSSIRLALRDQCPHFTQHWCTTAGTLFPGLTAAFPSLVPHLDRPRFANLERQVPDAIFVHTDETRVVIIELARTDDLLDGYWRDRRAAKDEKYRPLREAIAAATGATVVQATLVIGFRGGLCESEWRAQLAPLGLSSSAFLELRRHAVRSTVLDRKSTRLNSSHSQQSRMPSSA